ncbi:TadE/TadG family type IV pilus assembly protein [Aureimonas ureilytica]|uniref:TadE/TadG family type IV pilus assembly protein n=1 Tax=Aureimonas ureilytica TaxID=401562 RepID=UPI003CFB61C3
MFKGYWIDRRGNFAIMAALTFSVLALAIGGAVDISMVSMDETSAQSAADAAALAGAKTMESGSVAEAQIAIQAVALANLPDRLKSSKITGDIDTAQGVVNVVVSNSYDTAFLRLGGTKTISYSRSSQSSIKRDGFMDFYFLLDVSESMNIAADEVEREKLEDWTAEKNDRPCAFACHTPEDWTKWRISAYEMNQLIPPERGGPARLRIDVLRDAFKTTVHDLLKVSADKNQNLSIRISTAGFSEIFSEGVKKSTDEKALGDSIDFKNIPSAHTYLSNAFLGFELMLGKQYDGSSQDKPEKVAVIITDGVNDVPIGRSPWMQTAPVEQTYCNRIKAKGIKLAVLEIKYVDNYDKDGFFQSRVGATYPKLSPALMMCASPGYYYLATDSNQASERLAGLANEIVRRNLRIRQ